MLRQSKKIFCGGFLSFFTGEDDPYTLSEQMIQERIEDIEKSMPVDGWERVKFGFLHVDEYGERTPVYHNLWSTTLTAGVLGAFYGGCKTGQMAYADFMRTNQATAFLTHLDAKKRLQDRMMVSFLNGALKLGWRTSLFTFMFFGVTNAVALYRNKDGVLEYALGGAAAGTSYRMHIGLRQTIVGAILGCGFGTAAGVLGNAILYATGFTMSDVRNAQYAFAIHRASADRRQQDLGERDCEVTEKSELQARIEKDEKLHRIEDNLENV